MLDNIKQAKRFATATQANLKKWRKTKTLIKTVIDMNHFGNWDSKNKVIKERTVRSIIRQ